MIVVEAEAMGMCFGVRDALAVADALAEPSDTTVHGELVHNEAILARLRARGFSMTPENARDAPPATPRVLVTAHGISDRERARLSATGAELIDTTCPLVRRAHAAARRLAAECEHVVVLGKPGHVEVRGLTEDLPSFSVVPDERAVRCWFVRRLGVLCQTTFPPHRAETLLRAVRQNNPGTEVRFADTICEPTRQRLLAVQDLAARVDVMIVLGGANSNNTRELVRMCARLGTTAHHVQSAHDLDPAWFTEDAVVGLTAGTSTPGEVIEEVRAALRAWPARATSTGTSDAEANGAAARPMSTQLAP
jgi:4-hydroxy-3-methylbut-2-enyl diphosphate reductase